MLIYADIFLYMILIAISVTIIDHVGGTINPIISLLFMSSCATICFNLISYNKLKETYGAVLKYKLICAYITLTIGINWLCTIFAPYESDPFIYTASSAITLAICAVISQFSIRRSFIDIVILISLCSCILIMRYSYVIRHDKSIDIGIVLGIICGISAYFYASYSTKLCQLAKLSSSQILSLRFWPLIIALSIFTLLHHIRFSGILHNIDILCFMAIITLILPIFFLQQSFKKLGVIKSSRILCVSPTITFIIYSVHVREINRINLGICLLILLTLLLPKILTTLTK